MTKRKSGSKEGKGGDAPSQLIDARIEELSDWRTLQASSTPASKATPGVPSIP
jgi:hypothetical protein